MLDNGTVSECNPALVAQGGYADSQPDVDPKTGFYITDALCGPGSKIGRAQV